MKDIETRPVKISAIFGLILLFLSLPMFISFSLLILSSFSEEMVTNFKNFSFTLKNWAELFKGHLSLTGGFTYHVWKIFLNTLVVATGVAIIVAFVSALGGYALSRINFRGRKFLMYLLLILHAFPGVAIIVGVYALYMLTLPQRNLMVYYSFFYVILARGALELPMSVWLMKGFFDSVPWELEWCAIIDGAGRWKIWKEIMIPLVKPGLLAVALFAFLAGWQDIIYVRTFLITPTLATFIESNISVEFSYMPIIAAIGTLYLLPTIFFFLTARKFLLQKHEGGLKG